jgi:outer membrane protein OmpA-like peptidoglycan-associated protein
MYKRCSKAGLVVAAATLVASSASAQSQPANPTQSRVASSQSEARQDQVPVYRITVVGRSTPSINYRHRGGATTIGFRGTLLLPDSRGEAKVESKQGYIEIEVEFDELEPASRFGPEYLTYVMWAVTPDGRATNLGEVLLNGTESKLNVTTELQAFGLIVTAEPYFSVSQPSDVVVMENRVRPDTRGKVEMVDARYDLLKRGTYLMNRDPSELPVRKMSSKMPLELYEARNAVALSRFAGADEYSGDTFQRAARQLDEAEALQKKNKNKRSIIMAAREAAQTAEDARLIALQRQEEEQVAKAREAAAAREAEANRVAMMEQQRREAAEADRRAAEQRRIEAEDAAVRSARDREEADAARIAAERARADAEAAQQQLVAQRAAAEQDRAAAQQERAAAEAARVAADARANDARQIAEQAQREQADLRQRLQQQLNIILETRESARGLIVNMSDVLFDTAQATLRPGAREKLAKVAGVLLAYPGLSLEVEGHTDSVGNDSYNQGLSERRAASVRAYLIQQGIRQETINATGLGESQPVVSNDTAAGRQQNRRVELVVSGEAIGTKNSTQ